MNIGQAAQASGITAKMIRHYESKGLLPAAARSESGYRQYSEQDLHSLRFVRQARALGFSLAEVQTLLSLWQDRARPSREVKALALAHCEELEQKAQQLLAMKSALMQLVQACHGDERPHCPILSSLASDEAATSPPGLEA